MTRRQAKLLVIEDDPGDVDLLIEMLPDEITEVISIECVDRLATGLRRLTKGDIDVILLDLSLPDSHGIDTFEQVHAQAPDVPIIVLTGLEDQEIARKSMAKGAHDFLVKGTVGKGSFVLSLKDAINRQLG